MANQFWWNEAADRMYLGDQPIHAGDSMAVLTRWGWVRGRGESADAGRRIIFYLPIYEGAAYIEEGEEVMGWTCATVPLVRRWRDGRLEVTRHLRAAWPDDAGLALRYTCAGSPGGVASGVGKRTHSHHGRDTWQ